MNKDLIPTFSKGEGHLNTALAYLNSSIGITSENVEQRFKVDVEEQKFIKDIKHRPSPNGEG